MKSTLMHLCNHVPLVSIAGVDRHHLAKYHMNPRTPTIPPRRSPPHYVQFGMLLQILWDSYALQLDYDDTLESTECFTFGNNSPQKSDNIREHREAIRHLICAKFQCRSESAPFDSSSTSECLVSVERNGSAIEEYKQLECRASRLSSS